MSSDLHIFLLNAKELLIEQKRATFLLSQSLTEQDLNAILDGKRELSLSFAISLASHLGIQLERLVTRDLTKKRIDLKLLVLDIDGVLTEGGMYYSQSGDEFKRFHTRDGMAIKKLTRSGFQVAFLSSGINDKLVRSRAQLLGVQNVYVGLDPKQGILSKWKDTLDLSWDQIAYIGDDVNDLEVMGLCGFTACPSDAADKVRAIADVVLQTGGGHGCVREFIEEYLIEV